MSPLVAALLQMSVLVVALAAAYRPVGDYIARIARVPDARSGRAQPLPRHRGRPRGRPAVVGLPSLGAGLLRGRRSWASTRCCACRPRCPFSLGRDGMPPLQALNTAVSFVTNTNWQSYSGEAALGYTVADGRAGRAELPLGRRRHRRRGGARALVRAHPYRPRRQLLGRPHPHHAAGAAADGRGRSASCCWSAASSRTSPATPPSRPCPERPRRSRAGRWPARKRSRSSARTAVASSTPTPRTRSRTPAASRTCCEIFLHPGHPVSLHAHVRPDRRGPPPGLRGPRA